MLLARDADKSRAVIHRALVFVAVVCCALVSASFVMFARDQISGASKHQQNEIIASTPTTTGPVPIHTSHAQPRAFIDQAAHTLTSPFSAVVQSNSAWMERGIPTVLALLVYGVGLGYLARYSQGMS
jgi:hypothetical protein